MWDWQGQMKKYPQTFYDSFSKPQEVIFNVKLGSSISLEDKVGIFFIEKDHTPKSFFCQLW